MELPDLDAIEARANAATGRLDWQGIDALRSLVETDVPALVAALREARAATDNLTRSLMQVTDDAHRIATEREEERAEVERLRVKLLVAEECLASEVDHLGEDLNEARAEVERLTRFIEDDTVLALAVREQSATADRASLRAQRDDWRRRYEALRDGVTGLCDGWESGANDYDGGPLVNAEAFASDLRAVVARVEGDES